MKQLDEIVLIFPDVEFILHGQGAVCVMRLVPLSGTGGVSSFSVQSIESVCRESGIFSTVGTSSLIYLSAS